MSGGEPKPCAHYWAEVIDGVVTDIAIVTPEYKANHAERYSGTWLDLGESSTVCAGWTWDGEQFNPQEETE